MSAVCRPCCLFWYLYLAHLLADYPLQTDGLMRVKDRWWGRGLHVGVHLAVLLLVLGSSRRVLWPYVLALSAVHFALDSGKRWLAGLRPQWVAAPYFLDQGLHLIVILLVVVWIEVTVPAGLLPPLRLWPVYATGLLLATYAWYVTERVLAHAQESYLREVIDQRWPRMGVRGGLLALFLLSLRLLPTPAHAKAEAPLLLGSTFSMPYLSGSFRKRALIVDIVVPIVVTALVAWATWP
jgi:hypothetical protein